MPSIEDIGKHEKGSVTDMISVCDVSVWYLLDAYLQDVEDSRMWGQSIVNPEYDELVRP
jgi:hypothetical protein